MPEKPGAGDLRERVAFSTRITINPDAPDDFGNTVSEWFEQFQCAAQFIHLRGGEAVMAARLAGRHTQVVRIRASTQSREIGTDWQMTDVRTGKVFNVRDVTHTPDRAWVELLCESGVA